MALSKRLIHTAAAFFVVGVSLGAYMGAKQDFRFVHAHAHINLLGWVALGLIGLIYRVHPHLQKGWLTHAHYWLHTVGLVVFMGSFVWGITAGAKALPFIATGASMVSLAVPLFAVNVFMRLRSNDSAAYK
jgi:cbb3-type cytochrome oxidase subunit 1